MVHLYLNQNIPGVKKVAAKNKKASMKKMWNQIGWPRPATVDEIKANGI